MVAVRIGYEEADLRERAKRLSAIWRPQQKLREMRWLDAKRLGIANRARSTWSFRSIYQQTSAGKSPDLPVDRCIYLLIVLACLVCWINTTPHGPISL